MFCYVLDNKGHPPVELFMGKLISDPDLLLESEE